MTNSGGSSNSKDLVRVEVSKLAPCLTCSLCNNLFVNATTISECLHTFCHKCIKSKIEKENLRSCPLCNVDLGTHPLEKLRFDNSLNDLRQKLLGNHLNITKGTRKEKTKKIKKNAAVDHHISSSTRFVPPAEPASNNANCRQEQDPSISRGPRGGTRDDGSTSGRQPRELIDLEKLPANEEENDAVLADLVDNTALITKPAAGGSSSMVQQIKAPELPSAEHVQGSAAGPVGKEKAEASSSSSRVDLIKTAFWKEFSYCLDKAIQKREASRSLQLRGATSESPILIQDDDNNDGTVNTAGPSPSCALPAANNTTANSLLIYQRRDDHEYLLQRPTNSDAPSPHDGDTPAPARLPAAQTHDHPLPRHVVAGSSSSRRYRRDKQPIASSSAATTSSSSNSKDERDDDDDEDYSIYGGSCAGTIRRRQLPQRSCRGRIIRIREEAPYMKDTSTEFEITPSDILKAHRDGLKFMEMGGDPRTKIKNDKIFIALLPKEHLTDGRPSLPPLGGRFLGLDLHATISNVQQYVALKLHLQNPDEIEVTLHDNPLAPNMMMFSVVDVWLKKLKKYPSSAGYVTVQYGSSAERFTLHLYYALKPLHRLELPASTSCLPA